MLKSKKSLFKKSVNIPTPWPYTLERQSFPAEWQTGEFVPVVDIIPAKPEKTEERDEEIKRRLRPLRRTKDKRYYEDPERGISYYEGQPIPKTPPSQGLTTHQLFQFVHSKKAYRKLI